MDDKVPYVCGPLTELPPEMVDSVKRLYERVADACKEITGNRGFVPHEHYDPVEHAQYFPEDVYKAERRQVCERTSCLIIVAWAPSWGGGTEVEMANQNGIPAILIYNYKRPVSRLLKGSPAIKKIITHPNHKEILRLLPKALLEILGKKAAD